MTTIVRLALAGTTIEARWAAITARVDAWAAAQDVALRDAILLLPFAQLLAPARRAFGRSAGWMPRIETSQTLAAGLGPPALSPAGTLSFDTTIDLLAADALLRGRPWAATWARRDARAYAQGLRGMVDTAQSLSRAAFALPPGGRDAHWAAAREALGAVAGPGASERLLARVALEWASQTPPPATDRLFALAPSAWIVLQAGGADAFATHLTVAAGTPALILDTDAPPDDPFAGVDARAAPASALCEGFEDEAQCATAQVLAHLQAGESPVALIAADRLLVRRIRALLGRHAVPLLDETGWKLSTTRAAAQVVTLLRAARGDAGTDALMDWLKSGTAWASGDASSGLAELESACRRGPFQRLDALDRAALGPAAMRLWRLAAAARHALAATPRQALGDWLTSLTTALEACGALAMLRRDDAGRQLLTALHLTGAPSDLRSSPTVLSLQGFGDWVDAVLEDTNYRPTPSADTTPLVVITPLARAMLRPFAAVVFPGADDRHLGAAPPSPGLLTEAQNLLLGIPTAEARRRAELLAFAQIVAMPKLSLTRRRVDGKEPLADSPLVERLAMALTARGSALARWVDPRATVMLDPAPIRMSAPSAVAWLPARLSASSCEALRACPYRFFALNMLRLREDEELEREVDKRDYGNWLHEVLHDFHRERDVPGSAVDETAHLFALGERQRLARGLADTDFLPFDASFTAFVPHYIDWLHARDAVGIRWRSGEEAMSAFPDAWEGTEMHGVLDRIDEALAGEHGFELIDYKTGSVSALKDKVREPLEDTQLAFYAALMRARTDRPMQALYLPLDGKEQLKPIRHPEVEASAEALVDGLAHDLRRLRAGVGLPALGEGATCGFCAARGVCRRDHWSDATSSAEPATLNGPPA